MFYYLRSSAKFEFISRYIFSDDFTRSRSIVNFLFCFLCSRYTLTIKEILEETFLAKNVFFINNFQFSSSQKYFFLKLDWYISTNQVMYYTCWKWNLLMCLFKSPDCPYAFSHRLHWCCLRPSCTVSTWTFKFLGVLKLLWHFSQI